MEIYNGTHCVYVHTNKINGKVYVGQTVYGDNPNSRWRNGTGYVHSPYFYNAIQKYGWDNFEHEIIASNLTKEEADNFERLLIVTMNTFNNKFGYNMTLGGEGSSGRHPTEETRRKTSEALKGIKRSDETKAKIGRASLGRNVGRKHTKEELEKMKNKRIRRQTKKGESALKNVPKSEDTKRKIQNSSHKKSVLQKDLNGKILNQYISLSEASRVTGVNLGNISSCCNGRVLTAGGFMWDFS